MRGIATVLQSLCDQKYTILCEIEHILYTFSHKDPFLNWWNFPNKWSPGSYLPLPSAEALTSSEETALALGILVAPPPNHGLVNFVGNIDDKIDRNCVIFAHSHVHELVGPADLKNEILISEMAMIRNSN
jgi:hypothetical protein